MRKCELWWQAAGKVGDQSLSVGISEQQTHPLKFELLMKEKWEDWRELVGAGVEAQQAEGERAAAPPRHPHARARHLPTQTCTQLLV